MVHQNFQKRVMPFMLLGLLCMLLACSSAPKSAFRVDGKNIRIGFDENLYSRVTAKIDKKTMLGDFSPSEFITVDGNAVKEFTLTDHTAEKINDAIGSGQRYVIIGDSESLQKEIEITIYDDFPSMAVYEVKYTNTSTSELKIDSWTNNSYTINAIQYSGDTPSFWSYQSGSYQKRPDWVLPLQEGFKQENYLGMNATDYGGGTPVSDVWRKDAGIAVGHMEMVPKLVSLPVSMPTGDHAELGITYKVNESLAPGMSLITFKTFVAVHEGDYFSTLSEYRRFMIAQGVEFKETPDTAYEPIWCAWGFRRDFKIDQIYGALPKVKELGYKWAVLDDGWQTAEGDWYLVRDKFPRGDRDMKRLVDKIHSYGLKAKLWWAPLAVDPGTDLIKRHSDYLLLNEDGSTQRISWWNAFYLCPAYPEVQQYTKRLVEKIMKDWGYDGLKIDGQHLNLAPPCYNKAHNHARPEEAVEGISEFFKIIYETALSINPEAVVEICPCGTAYNFHVMPFMNQPVASDPTSSWQIRSKGKTFKALMGPSVAYYGDHVELSDGREDFASTVGIGGVVGTKFTWPVGAMEKSRVELTPEREKKWKKWLDIYEEKMLPKGTYMGSLYDIGFDRPETHAVQKDGNMYYAFYAEKYNGEVELRGLEKGTYRVVDYVNSAELGSVKGPVAKLDVDFEGFILLEVTPE